MSWNENGTPGRVCVHQHGTGSPHWCTTAVQLWCIRNEQNARAVHTRGAFTLCCDASKRKAVEQPGVNNGAVDVRVHEPRAHAQPAECLANAYTVVGIIRAGIERIVAGIQGQSQTAADIEVESRLVIGVMVHRVIPDLAAHRAVAEPRVYFPEIEIAFAGIGIDNRAGVPTQARLQLLTITAEPVHAQPRVRTGNMAGRGGGPRIETAGVLSIHTAEQRG